MIQEMIEAGVNALQLQQQEDRIAERGTADKQNPYVTDAGKCPRAVGLSMLNIPGKPFTTDTLINFGLGHAAEEFLAKALEAGTDSMVKREVRIEIPTEGTVVSGRADFILWDQGLIVELKNTSTMAMKYLEEGGRPEHRSQLNLYLHATGLPAGALVYMAKAAKGMITTKEYEVNYDKHQALEDLAALEAIDAHVKKTGEAPDKPDGYLQSKYPCSYCQYSVHCWSIPKQETK